MVIGHLTGMDIRPHRQDEGRQVAETRSERPVQDVSRTADGLGRAAPLVVVRTVIRAVQMAHHEQVRMWECVLLRWVRSLDGYRLAGSHLPAQDPAETGR